MHRRANGRLDGSEIPLSIANPKSFRAFKKVFDDFDLDGNGYVDRKEFTMAVEVQAPHLKGNKHLAAAFAKIDKNGDKKLSFEELVLTLYPHTSRSILNAFLAKEMGTKKKEKIKAHINKKKMEEARELFQIYDKDNDGVLSLAEFKEVMIKAFSVNETLDLFNQVDKNNDEKISFEEFRDWYEDGESDDEGASKGSKDEPSDFVDNSHMGSATAEIAKRMAIDFKLNMGLADQARSLNHNGSAR